MEKIFLIFDNPTDYEIESSVIGFTESEEKADRLVFDLNEEHRKATTFFSLLNERVRLYEFTSPPHAGFEATISTGIPRVIDNRKEVTQAMRDERKRIQDANIEIARRNADRYTEHCKAKMLMLKSSFDDKDPKWLEDNFKITDTYFLFKNDGLSPNAPYRVVPCDKLA